MYYNHCATWRELYLGRSRSFGLESPTILRDFSILLVS